MKNVPFYANTKDDTHCYQAVLKMILKFFIPKKSFSWKTLDIMTGKTKGMWTWPMRGAISLARMGFEVRDIEIFDYDRFVQEPETYLRAEFGHEVAGEQIRHSDVVQAARDVREFLRVTTIEKRIPTRVDMQELLRDRCLLICLVNSQNLNRKKGYVGHFVVVWKNTDKTVTLHDPGLPPRKNRRVSWDVFEKSWADPNEKAKMILAFQLKEFRGV